MDQNLNPELVEQQGSKPGQVASHNVFDQQSNVTPIHDQAAEEFAKQNEAELAAAQESGMMDGPTVPVNQPAVDDVPNKDYEGNCGS